LAAPVRGHAAKAQEESLASRFRPTRALKRAMRAARRPPSFTFQRTRLAEATLREDRTISAF
jgi:hypothetical protein